MKTIQILRLKQKEQKKLLRILYDEFLIEDTLWHYFLEPDLIIRVKNAKIIKEITTFLHLNYINFVIYDYPIAPDPINEGGRDYDEAPKSITINYLKHFLAVYHVQCVFYMEIKDIDKKEMRAKIIHSLINEDFMNYDEEMHELNKLTLRRAMIIGRYGK